MDSGKINYRELRFRNLNSERYRHLWLLLFWPIFGIVFQILESGALTKHYHPVQCALDGKIPFCEFFVIPYLIWFIIIPGLLLYGLFFEVDVFKNLMKYIILTYGATIIIYIIYPTEQLLRPAAFTRDNPLTRFMADFYAFDTRTNVCPSIHVIGAVAVMLAAWKSKRFSSVGWKIAFGITALLICLSTVFLKQHSAVDVIAAAPVCAAAYFIVYRRKRTVKNVHYKEKALR